MANISSWLFCSYDQSFHEEDCVKREKGCSVSKTAVSSIPALESQFPPKKINKKVSSYPSQLEESAEDDWIAQLAFKWKKLTATEPNVNNRMASRLRTYDVTSGNIELAEKELKIAQTDYQQQSTNTALVLKIAENALLLAAAHRENKKRAVTERQEKFYEEKETELIKYVHELGEKIQRQYPLDPIGYYVISLSLDFNGMECTSMAVLGKAHHYIYNLRYCYALDREKYSFTQQIVQDAYNFCQNYWLMLSVDRRQGSVMISDSRYAENMKFLDTFMSSVLPRDLFIHWPHLFDLANDTRYAKLFADHPYLTDKVLLLQQYPKDAKVVDFIRKEFSIDPEDAILLSPIENSNNPAPLILGTKETGYKTYLLVPGCKEKFLCTINPAAIKKED